MSQGTPNVAAYQSSFDTGLTYVFSSNIADNTFGRQISLKPIINVDEFFHPQIALDNKTNQAVLADSLGCPEPGCVSSIALVDLATGKISKFTDNLGLGTVNGLAVDSENGIACTTTLSDGGVEFYDLAKKTGFEVQIANYDGTPLDSGLDVEFDPIHHVFLISQWSSNGGNVRRPTTPGLCLRRGRKSEGDNPGSTAPDQSRDDSVEPRQANRLSFSYRG